MPLTGGALPPGLHGARCGAWYHPRMADSAWAPGIAATVSASEESPRHATVVRVTHWVTAFCFFALLVSGIEILISHPRFYWGETGNSLTPPLFSLPIPASRASVPTGYDFVLPDQNGWSRSLHFQSAWAAVFTGSLYVLYGLFTGHFQKNLLPAGADLSRRALSGVIANHLRFKPPREAEAWSYNVLQRLTYLLVIFFVFPLAIWTGLVMSPALSSAFPSAVAILGGQQSARTIHFFVSLILVLFVLAHVFMVWLAGFKNRVKAMIVGRPGESSAPADHGGSA